MVIGKQPEVIMYGLFLCLCIIGNGLPVSSVIILSICPLMLLMMNTGCGVKTAHKIAMAAIITKYPTHIVDTFFI